MTLIFKVKANICGYYRFKIHTSSKEEAIEMAYKQAEKINSGELKVSNFYSIGIVEQKNNIIVDYCFLGSLNISVVAKDEIIADKRAVNMIKKHYDFGDLKEIQCETVAIRKE